MVETKLTSASGLLALLEEDQNALKSHALKSLISVVDDHWAEVAGSISVCEALYEDDDFPQREYAALLASKVFYHLGELNDSLTYALGAGNLFDVNDNSDYVQTLVAKCIDEYVELRVKASEETGNIDGKDDNIDQRLVTIVERMFDRCFRASEFRQAIGIALESRRLDKVEAAVLAQPSPALRAATLTYTLTAALTLVTSRTFRQKVLSVLVKLYESSATCDYVSMCTCLMFLDDHAAVATILDKLLQGSQDDALMAYQIGFDLFENEVQQFLLKVRDQMAKDADAPPPAPTPLPAVAPPAAAPTPPQADAAATAEDGAEAMDSEGGGDVVDSPAAPVVAAPPPLEVRPVEDLREPKRTTQEYQERWTSLSKCLSGSATISVHLRFLASHCAADRTILKNIKESLDTRNSVCHSATILANAIMHAGTTQDTFLRDNLDWLSKANNWAKFSATAGLGVIHRGHLSQGRALMEPYLPSGASPSVSPYSEGGALYALGLIHVSAGSDIMPFLTQSLRAAASPTIQHGACLGLGLAGLGGGGEGCFQDIKDVLYSDNAVAGEAAGLGMGMLMAGQGAGDQAVEMLGYAHETQHEKIIRGLGMGCALTVYGREEEAEPFLQQMCLDADPIIRYGGMFATALAYRGTANNNAIRSLLHFAVSDVSDDVRRAAVLGLGFVLYMTPEQCPRVVALLAESYNPHMRYGAAMAVGIACGGTGLPSAVALLESLTGDSVDYVRQGALISLAMVLMQHPEGKEGGRESKVGSLRKLLDKLIQDKHEDTMCKMGAITAAGILDAGGRNMTIALRSHSGQHRMASVVGMAVFCQYWYWHPLAYCLSLPLTPTVLIALNQDLQMPAFQVTSLCKPSLFSYAQPLSATSTANVTKAPTAVLSTTAKARAKAKKATDSKPSTAASTTAEDGGGLDAMDTGADADASSAPSGENEKEKKEKVVEPSTEMLQNPARVVPPQEKFIRFQEGIGVRYAPVKRTPAGIIMVRDTMPDLPVVLVEEPNSTPESTGPTAAITQAPLPVLPVEDDEPAPPEPFEYVPPS